MNIVCDCCYNNICVSSDILLLHVSWSASTSSFSVVFNILNDLHWFVGEDTTDDVANIGLESNECDLDQMKDINRDQWLQQYGKYIPWSLIWIW